MEKYGDFLEHYFTNNPGLKSELRVINYKILDKQINFYSDNGVFSKDKIDYGSNFLLETFLKHGNYEKNKILDVGCGYGLIGITLAKFLDSEVTMCDVNLRALHLANKNVDLNKVSATIVESDAYQKISETYDLIITNPPIRAGKEKVYEILDDAKNYLTKDGELWCVIRKDQGAKSTLKHLELIYNCEIVAKSKGFYIIKAKNR